MTMNKSMGSACLKKVEIKYFDVGFNTKHGEKTLYLMLEHREEAEKCAQMWQKSNNHPYYAVECWLTLDKDGLENIKRRFAQSLLDIEGFKKRLAYVWATVTDDSMYNTSPNSPITIPIDSQIAIDTSNTSLEVGKIYVFKLDDDNQLLRKVGYLNDETITLTPLNHNYKTIVESRDACEVVGRLADVYVDLYPDENEATE